MAGRDEEDDDKTERRPRADATRNRERILTSATAIFNAGGPDASLEAVARHAEVGIGTLYRHFPTREALYEAIYRREVDQLAELAERLKNAPLPVPALRKWLHANIELVATKKGMGAALALAAHKPPELYAYSFETLTSAARMLLDRAIANGDLRADVSAEDILRTLIGISYLHEQPGWQKNVKRLMDVFLDGMVRDPAQR